eukprot:gene4002-7258_t
MTFQLFGLVVIFSEPIPLENYSAHSLLKQLIFLLFCFSVFSKGNFLINRFYRSGDCTGKQDHGMFQQTNICINSQTLTNCNATHFKVDICTQDCSQCHQYMVQPINFCNVGSKTECENGLPKIKEKGIIVRLFAAPYCGSMPSGEIGGYIEDESCVQTSEFASTHVYFNKTEREREYGVLVLTLT